MEPRCTCGAFLPQDARFCHKCGKPQYEEDIVRLREQESVPPPAPPLTVAPRPAEVSVRNMRAVAITVIMAASAFVISGAAVVVSPFLFPFVLLAAGFFAALIYGNRAPVPISAAAGAFLGWLTGLWLFLVFAISLVSPAGSEAIRQIQSAPQFAQLHMQNPQQLLVFAGFACFCIVTFLPGLGGILGASLSARRRSHS